MAKKTLLSWLSQRTTTAGLSKPSRTLSSRWRCFGPPKVQLPKITLTRTLGSLPQNSLRNIGKQSRKDSGCALASDPTLQQMTLVAQSLLHVVGKSDPDVSPKDPMCSWSSKVMYAVWKCLLHMMSLSTQTLLRFCMWVHCHSVKKGTCLLYTSPSPRD